MISVPDVGNRRDFGAGIPGEGVKPQQVDESNRSVGSDLTAILVSFPSRAGRGGITGTRTVPAKSGNECRAIAVADSSA